MFQPYAASGKMDVAGIIPVVSTVTGSARFLYGMTKFLANGSLAAINRISHKRFGNEPWEAALDGALASSRGLIEIIPFVGFLCFPMMNGAKFYKTKDNMWTLHGLDLPRRMESAKYSGEMKYGFPCGSGILKLKDGTTYSGKFQNSGKFLNISGNGVIKYPNGETYEGDWNHIGEFHGKGKFTHANGEQYDGDWYCGLRHGKGSYTYQDGSLFYGDWKSNERHGKGILTESDGTQIQGVWGFNLISGDFYLTDAEGVKTKHICSAGGEVLTLKQGKAKGFR